jgi:small subunit ribosomal protein S19
VSRSSKKGPYYNEKLLKKVLKQRETNKHEQIKTWARSCTVLPDFVDQVFLVHNGKIFQKVVVREEMVGHKLGEFALTRTFRGHTKKDKGK